MLANALFELTKTDYFGDHIRALTTSKGISYPQLARKIEPLRDAERDARAVSPERVKQWAIDNVRLPVWAQEAIVSAYGLQADYFEKPVDKQVDGGEKGVIVENKTSSAETHEPPVPTMVLVPLIYLREDSMLRQALDQPPTSFINVPAWIADKSLYAIRVDTDAFHPFADRGDVLVVRPHDPFRERKLSIVSRKSDGRPLVGMTVRDGGKTLFRSSVDEPALPVDDFLNDGLVVYRLPNYIENRIRGEVDDEGIDGPELSG